MNLIGDPWIPVMFQDGQTDTVGLNDIYGQAEEIRDLALAPPQRIAVIRLLICITQAALDGPEDKDEWLSCKDRIGRESLAYLEERKEKFDLFGKTPFMQIRNLEVDKDQFAQLDKLDFRLASGNNKTLFDQSSMQEGRIHPAGWVSLQLLTFLNFSTGGKVGQAVWHNQTFSKSTKAAPALKAAHLFVRGGNLCETIWLNLLAKEDVLNKMPNRTWGKPVWDAFPQSPDNKACVENATQTYLGRLVPLTRFIKVYPLDKENDQVSPSCIIGPPTETLSFEGPPGYREPSTTIIEKNGGQDYLSVSIDKHIWRDLGSVLVLGSDSNTGGALTLENLRRVDKDRIFDLWVGGLIPSQAAIEDAVEWNLALYVHLLDGERQLQSYRTNVELAERSAISLSKAVQTYLDEMKAYKGNDPRSKDARKGVAKRATSIYWQELDQRHGLLFEDRSVDDDWRCIIRNALSNAYEQSCVHEAPRQIQAYVAGQKRLGFHKLMMKGDENGRSE